MRGRVSDNRMLCQPKVGLEAELDVASIHEWEKGVKKQPAVVIIKKYFLAGVPWSSTTIRIVVLQDLAPVINRFAIKQED